MLVVNVNVIYCLYQCCSNYLLRAAQSEGMGLSRCHNVMRVLEHLDMVRGSLSAT